MTYPFQVIIVKTYKVGILLNKKDASITISTVPYPLHLLASHHFILKKRPNYYEFNRNMIFAC